MPYRRELLARWASLFLILLLPALTLLRLVLPPEDALASGALGRGAPAPPAPSYVHLLVVTVAEWPADTPDALPELRAFRARAGRAARAFTDATSRAAAATSLWTGTRPDAHGVLDESWALPRSAWTLADSARRGGFATAAFLEEPFVSVTGIHGFEEVHERTELDPHRLARDAVDFLQRNRGHRTLTWVHFALQGTGLDPLETLLGGVARELEQSGDRAEFLGVLTAFRRELGAPGATGGPGTTGTTGAAGSPEPWHVPLVVRFPGDATADRPGNGLLALSDLTGMLRSILRTPPPDPLAGQLPITSRGDYAQEILRGSRGSLWTWFRTPDELLFIEDEAIVRAPVTDGRPDTSALRFDWQQAPSTSDTQGGIYRDLAERFEKAYTAPQPTPPRHVAERPRAWRDLRGW